MISSTGSSIPMDTLRISPVDICGRPHILRQSSADGPRRRPSLLLFGYAMQLRIKLYDLILAFANALDQVHPALTGHHRRVGFLLDRLAERLGLPSEERERLFLAGIMHDVGVIPLKTSAEDLVFERERYLHPQAGCLFLQNCPTLAEEAERVRFHHMYWEKACDRGLAAREGSLINIADRVDVDLRAKNDFREAVEGAVDVIVSDGYSGNIFLKTMEGTGGFMAKQLKAMFKKNLLTKLAAVLVSGGLRDFKKMMDAGEVGGTPLIGISKPVIKAHGSSDAFAIKNAIRQAQSFAASGIIEDITENIDHMRLRSE